MFIRDTLLTFSHRLHGELPSIIV